MDYDTLLSKYAGFLKNGRKSEGISMLAKAIGDPFQQTLAQRFVDLEGRGRILDKHLRVKQSGLFLGLVDSIPDKEKAMELETMERKLFPKKATKESDNE